MSPETKLFFSFSTKPGNFGSTVYNELFLRREINAIYLPRVAPADSGGLLQSLVSIGASGASISMPLKSAIIPQLNEADENVIATNSCNTVIFQKGKSLGYNTDIAGIKGALVKMGFKPRNPLIYGHGSVCNSIIRVLKDDYNCDTYFTGRSEQKMQLSKINAKQYADSAPFDLLINATPAKADENSQLADLIRASRAFLDLNVVPGKTSSIALAEQLGIPNGSGIDMAISQLSEQFFRYTGQVVNEREITDIVSLKYFGNDLERK